MSSFDTSVTASMCLVKSSEKSVDCMNKDREKERERKSLFNQSNRSVHLERRLREGEGGRERKLCHYLID